MSDYIVRECVAGDEVALSLVAQATILETYARWVRGANLYRYVTEELGEELFRTCLEDRAMRLWAAEVVPTGCIVGYAHALRDTTDPLAMELKRLYILHNFRSLGIGKRLMDESVSFACANASQSMVLRVHYRNEAAIGFYLGYGFQTIGEETFAAGDETSRVLVMRRDLPVL
ncbi:MAG: GNAT family N-acetyltransferase [Candidatus Eremiobacteraeota bacterium]|nr:GNAT family N-acetyltransferase [Candidatus Eremiobacteraeota bacterium]